MRKPEVRNFAVRVLKLDGSASFIQPMEPTRPLFVADGEEFAVLHEGATLITGAVKLQDRIEITGALSVGGKKFHASPWTADHSSRGTELSLLVVSYWLRFADAHGGRASFRFGAHLTQCRANGCYNVLISMDDGEVVTTATAQGGGTNSNLTHICHSCAMTLFHRTASTTIEGRPDLVLGSRQSTFKYKNTFKQFGFGGSKDLDTCRLSPQHLPLDVTIATATSSPRKARLDAAVS